MILKRLIIKNQYKTSSRFLSSFRPNLNNKTTLLSPELIRNLAIIAHVDHGKTTLVDCLLRQSGTLSNLKTDSRVMDSNDLEKERGITILSKCTSIMYNKYRINIVDTPGHADFGGEVERVLSMVNGVILVVDATEGPMTQTRFVLTKALKLNLRPIVVYNKVDRNTARVKEVENELFDLFCNLGATDQQMEYPSIYASAKFGWAVKHLDTDKVDMAPLFDTIINHIEPPKVERNKPFSMLVTQLENNVYLGKCYLGLISQGNIKIGSSIKAIDPNGNFIEDGKITKIFLQTGLEKNVIEEAAAGDIVSLSGLNNASVNHTLCDKSLNDPLPYVPIDPPTISMTFGVNDSPLSGKEGKQLTSTVIAERLFKEAETNVALKVTRNSSEELEVCGRGELQLGILIETMRREGFELSVSPPKVLFKKSEDGELLEPIEELVIDAPIEFSGIIIEKLSKRKANLKSQEESEHKVKLTFDIPMRGLLGYASEFKNDTHGQGIICHSFIGYEPARGKIEQTRKGSLLSMTKGTVTAHAASKIEARGKLFVTPGVDVYPGMIIGEYNKGFSDLEVNPARAKEVSNMRASGKEEAIKLTTVKPMTLEEAIAYVKSDEVIEITPLNIRLRKKELDPNKRKNLNRNKNTQLI